jgi:ankyrin repeat protein
MSFGRGVGVHPTTTTTTSDEIDASTPWMAASDGNLDLLQRSLTQLQLPPSVADEHGYTLLHAAASYSQTHIMQWLLLSSVNVNINAVDQEGDTALHYAATVQAATFLLQTGKIDRGVRNAAGKTALEAKQEELEEMIQDEDNDDEDQDFINLLNVVAFLQTTSSLAQ